MKTYFVGAVVLSFPTTYRRWRREREDEAAVRAAGAALDLEIHFAPDSYGDPGEKTARWAEIHAGLAGLPDERTRRAVTATSLGYSYAETAELLSVEREVSEGTVAQILHRQRRRTDKKEPA